MHRRLLPLGLFLLPAVAAAQEPARDTVRLDEIVVSATRLPMPRASVTATVTVLRGEDLRAEGVRTVADALRSVPGAEVARNGSYGAATSLFLRGGESDYVQVLVDGVAVNGPGGTYDFASLSTDNLDRIEVVAGPVSVLYGSDAVAGVVQIFTRRGQGPASVEGALSGGTHRTVALEAGLQGSGGNADYTFTVSRFATEGSYAYNNAHRNTVAAGRFHLAPDPRTDATVTLRYTDNVFHYPTDYAGVLADRNQFTFASGTTLGLEAGRRVSNRVELRMLLAWHETDDGSDDQPDSPIDTLGFYASRSLNHGSRRSGDVRANVYLSPRSILTVGGTLASEETRGISQSSSEYGPSSGASDAHRLNRAAYLQALLAPAGILSLTLGGRLDANDTFGTFGTSRAGAAVRVAAGLRLRGAVGTGFKEPTFYENFDSGFSTGNPDLRPERSTSWEAGLEQTAAGGRVRLGVVYFRQRFRDLIQYTFAPPAPGGPNYYNVASADASGLELTTRAAASGFVVEAAYAWLRTTVRDAGFDIGPDAAFVQGQRLLRRPGHTATLRLSRDLAGRGAVGAALRYVGDRDDLDFTTFPGGRPTLPAYTVLDLSAALVLVRTAPRLSATLRLENALDRRYSEVFNFPAPGRTLLVGGRAGF